MNMETKFYGLGSDLKEILYNEFNKNEDVFYIFENPTSYYEIKKEYLKISENIFHNFKLLKESDFYEKLLETDKIVIREEKQVVLFYNSLTNDIRKNLKIENYYDVIDLAYNFYNLFYELQEYKVDVNKIKIEEWQREVFENLLEINKYMEEQVNLKGLILPYTLRKKENISNIFINKIRKICFVNKVKFTPFEKEILEFIEKKGIIIENIIQLDKNDFDEEKLEIKVSFGLPDKEIFNTKGINLEIHQYDNKFSQLIGMVKNINEINSIDKSNFSYNIYDGQEMNNKIIKDYQLLNQNKVTYNLEETMQNTKIYKVLNLIYNILDNIKVESKIDGNKKYIFKMKELYNSFKFDEFLNIFNLKESYNQFQLLVSDNYKYISKEMLENLDKKNETPKNEKLILFLDEFEKLYNIDNLYDYGKYLEEIFEKQEKIEDNIRSKYFEALSEMVVLEDFSFDNLWSGFFKGNLSSSLLKMFLKYLDKKSISLDLEQQIDEQEDEKKYKISAFSTISDTKKENIIFLNLQDFFPKVKVNNYLFSKGQRKDMGLPINENIRQIEFFKFINNIFGAKNVHLSYVKNIDENIDCAGIIEEIKLKYGVKLDKDSNIGEISENEEIGFLKKYFTSQGEKWEKKEIGPFIKSRLKKDKNKLMDERLSLGYYSFEKIREFEYGYYLEKMIGNTEMEKIDDKIDPLLFGNIIHSVYEKIVKENKEAIENKEYFANIKDIKEVLLNVLTSFEYKIPTEFIKFYKEVSFDEIAKSIKRFFDDLKDGEIEEIKKINEFEIYSEEKVRQKLEKEMENAKYKNIFINGVMDLYIKVGLQEILIDYKSGKLDKSKLMKAFEQLDFYSILLGDEKINIRKKYILNTWDGVIEKDTRESDRTLSKETVNKVISHYFEREFYGLGENNRTFNHKIYKDIVRRDKEDNEDRK